MTIFAPPCYVFGSQKTFVACVKYRILSLFFLVFFQSLAIIVLFTTMGKSPKKRVCVSVGNTPHKLRTKKIRSEELKKTLFDGPIQSSKVSQIFFYK